MHKRHCACDRSITVLGAPQADQHRFRRTFEGLEPVVDVLNDRGAACVRARGELERESVYVSTLTKNLSLSLPNYRWKCTQD